MDNIRSKLIEKASKYIWDKLRIIFLMVFLFIIVKNHPGWDAFFIFVVISQFIFIVLKILELPNRIREEQFKQEFNNFKNKYKENYYRKNYNTGKISFTNDLTTSANLLDINIVQDDNDTIKKKYRKLAMKWHPDRFANDTLENQDIAKKNFQKVNGAYQKIKDYKNIN
jgi:hypothetical protein